MFESPFAEGIVGQAIAHKKVRLSTRNIRDFSKANIHKSVDDRPYGGSDGMVMLVEPILSAVQESKKNSESKNPWVIHLTPQGKSFTDQMARELLKYDHLILICGRYGGIDERAIATEVDDEISFGDFILSGGEIAAMALIDAVTRLAPGVLGNQESSLEESFLDGLLECPQFTRPREVNGLMVPEILLSGDHEKIHRWQHLVSILRTRSRRPDLLARAKLSNKDLKDAENLLSSMSEADKKVLL